MKKSALVLVIFSGLFFLIISCNTKPNLTLEEHKIRELYDGICKYAVEGNWEEYSKLLTNNSKLQIIHPGDGQWLKGREEFEKVYEPLIKPGINADYLKNDLTLYFSNSADMAWGTIDMIARFNDYDSLLVHSWNIVVFEKENSEWKVVLFNQAIPKNISKE